MAKLLLVKFNDDYADEFGVNGFHLFTEGEWNEYQDFVKSIDFPFNIYFGTNERLEYENGDRFLQRMAAREISQETYDIVKDLFGSVRFGIFPDKDDMEKL